MTGPLRMMRPDHRPLFTERYGISTASGHGPAARRHVPDVPYDQEHEIAPERVRCLCPGTTRLESADCRCRQRATQEDTLCDECRDWCIAIDSEQRIHRLIDLVRRGSVDV